MFQSLSGLSLGLNFLDPNDDPDPNDDVSIPFRAVTGFEQAAIAQVRGIKKKGFNPFQGCHWV